MAHQIDVAALLAEWGPVSGPRPRTRRPAAAHQDSGLPEGTRAALAALDAITELHALQQRQALAHGQLIGDPADGSLIPGGHARVGGGLSWPRGRVLL